VAFPAPIVDSVLFLSDFIILLGISIGFLILILKHHELFETVNAYFSLKSIHIIRNGGQLLFGYDFKEEKFEDISDSQRLLIAGIMSAVTSGLSESLALSEKVKSVELGDYNILFKHGKFVFGVLFSEEPSQILSEKLVRFITQFEKIYGESLKRWTGKMSIFKSNEAKDLIFEIFG